jgi:hypothetical protein
MTLEHYAQLVTKRVRERLPDVRGVRRGTTVVWTLGRRTATLNAAASNIWWLRIDAGSRGGQPLTYDERQNADSAHIAASNIVTHFDPRYCRGIDVAPYTDAEMTPTR